MQIIFQEAMDESLKRHSTYDLKGTLVGLSHVFYMSGGNSKCFFIEIQNVLSDRNIRKVKKYTILARIQNLHQSIKNIQVYKNRAGFWKKHERYHFHHK